MNCNIFISNSFFCLFLIVYGIKTIGNYLHLFKLLMAVLAFEIYYAHNETILKIFKR